MCLFVCENKCHASSNKYHSESSCRIGREAFVGPQELSSLNFQELSVGLSVGSEVSVGSLLLGARVLLLGAPGLTTRSKKLLGTRALLLVTRATFEITVTENRPRAATGPTAQDVVVDCLKAPRMGSNREMTRCQQVPHGHDGTHCLKLSDPN